MNWDFWIQIYKSSVPLAGLLLIMTNAPGWRLRKWFWVILLAFMPIINFVLAAFFLSAVFGVLIAVAYRLPGVLFAPIRSKKIRQEE